MKTLALALLSVDATSAALSLSFEVVVSICFVSALILFAISDYHQKPRRFKFEQTMVGVAPATAALQLAA